MKDLTINDLVVVPPRYRIMTRELSRNTSLSAWPRIRLRTESNLLSAVFLTRGILAENRAFFGTDLFSDRGHITIFFVLRVVTA